MLRAEIRFLRFYDVIVFTHVIVVFLANISVRILSTNKLISSTVKKNHLQQIVLNKNPILTHYKPCVPYHYYDTVLYNDTVL